MALYLGFDAGTQSLSAIVIEVDGDRRRILFEHSLNFDRDFPEYGTTAGIVRGDGPHEMLASPLMWADALDRMMSILASDAAIDIGAIRAISGAAQQHGSVYLNRRAREAWRVLAHERPLVPQLSGILARGLTPVWMDESAGEQAAAIEAALGGADTTARLTGSRAFARFAGPQIRKFRQTNPGGYDATTRIHLVSSFMASLLIGADAMLDPGDASGMNLMDIRSSRWSEAALEATAPGLVLKLPEIRPSWTIAGTLSRYWQDRYAFPAAQVVTWSGDNPSSLVGTGLVAEGHLAVSLGTSDTVFTHSRELRTGASHVFGASIGGYMNLVCFRNGSLTRDGVRRTHHLDWAGFSAALDRTPAGNGGAVMLPWLEPEITPPVRLAGVRRFAYDGNDADRDVRAVVEGQMMAMANHSAAIAGDLRSIVATGGASVNDSVLQVMADVFGAPVDRLTSENSACLGAALRAFHADRLAAGEPLSWPSVVKGFTDPRPEDRLLPRPDAVEVYRDLRVRYAEIERLHQDRAPIG
ncbi:MAG: FGGY-family carbohydrate kinase [Acidobacteriota bacterium]|nr:FGGY-family carbohydrate kinase [Acidobacteriota bacterium]